MVASTDEDPTGRLHHVPTSKLAGDTVQSSGMRRLEAISGALTGASNIWMGESHMEPATRSSDHHHGESETGIYVLRGHPVFVFLDGDEELRIETQPGDYVFVPPFVAHREENPSPGEEAVVILARSTQEAIVVNLTSSEPEEH
jgi:uncharacterized RmlC-like cupin family protein